MKSFPPLGARRILENSLHFWLATISYRFSGFFSILNELTPVRWIQHWPWHAIVLSVKNNTRSLFCALIPSTFHGNGNGIVRSLRYHLQPFQILFDIVILAVSIGSLMQRSILFHHTQHSQKVVKSFRSFCFFSLIPRQIPPCHGWSHSSHRCCSSHMCELFQWSSTILAHSLLTPVVLVCDEWKKF